MHGPGGLCTGPGWARLGGPCRVARALGQVGLEGGGPCTEPGRAGWSVDQTRLGWAGWSVHQTRLGTAGWSVHQARLGQSGWSMLRARFGWAGWSVHQARLGRAWKLTRSNRLGRAEKLIDRVELIHGYIQSSEFSSTQVCPKGTF